MHAKHLRRFRSTLAPLLNEHGGVFVDATRPRNTALALLHTAGARIQAAIQQSAHIPRAIDSGLLGGDHVREGDHETLAWRVMALSSFSAMFSQLPCFGV